jgi:hypothetical protein
MQLLPLLLAGEVALDMDSRPPSTVIKWRVWCPFCRRHHFHSPHSGPRVPHCGWKAPHDAYPYGYEIALATNVAEQPTWKAVLRGVSGGLEPSKPWPSERHIVGVQEPAYGKCRIK